ncbi:MAG: cytochrome P450 [Egibacteraceae bacterium]
MPGDAQRSPATEPDHGFDEITQAMTTPQFRENPYPLYERLRCEHPLYRGSQGAWYVTRYADVDAALRDPRLSNDRERRLRWSARCEGTDRLARGFAEVRMRLRGSTLSADPPDHTRLRRLVSKALAGRHVAALRPRIEAIVADLLHDAQATVPSFDLIAALAKPLPVTVICELLGIPAVDRWRIRQWTRALDDLEPAAAHANKALERIELERIEQVALEFEDYLRDLVRTRRAAPGDDLLSALIAVRERGDQLREDELSSTCLLLLATGHDSPVNLIGNGTLALLRNPDELRRLQENPTLIRAAIEELLRYDSPVQMQLRITAEAVEIAGEVLAEDEAVFTVLGAANHDPDQFPDPDRLDLARPTPRHLSFGNGPHFCLGARLARLEGQVAIGMLVQRFPTLRLDTDTIDWRPNLNPRGLASLPVAY